MNDNDKITSYGLFTTIVVTTVGIGIFSYPRDLAELVGNDGWFVTLAAGFICYIMLMVIWKVVKGSNYRHFSVMIRDRLGRAAGDIVLILFAVYNLLGISFGMRAFVEVIKMFLLDKTPSEFIIIVTILTGVYLIRGEFKSVVKFNEITFGIMFIPAFLILLLLLNVADFTNLLPLFQHKPGNYFSALAGSAFTFGGISIAFLAAPMLEKRKEGGRVFRRSVAFISIFYILIVILSIAVLSKEMTTKMLWPTITMIKSINLPGLLIERWEGVVMALWIMFYFTTFVNGYYFTSHIAKEVFFLGDIKISSFIIMPFIYIIAMYPKNIAEVYDFSGKIMPLFSLIAFIVIPLILLFLGRVRCRGEKEEV